jgi:hypothetical protein
MIDNSPYNFDKLRQELASLGYAHIISINSDGVVIARIDGVDESIERRPDVAALLAAHDPTPDPEPPSLQERLEAAELFLGLLLDQEVTR